MAFLDWAAMILGAMFVFSGIRASRRRETHVPERYAGDSAVRLGWLWIFPGVGVCQRRGLRYCTAKEFVLSVSRGRQLTGSASHFPNPDQLPP